MVQVDLASDSAAAPIQWAVASAPLGEVSGDLHLVLPGVPSSLIGVIDGLGHGHEAARAARECASLLAEHAGLPLDELVRLCHRGLRSTRGVAMTLAMIDSERSELRWTAVGNVEGLLLRRGVAGMNALEAVCQRGGVVGYRLPPVALRSMALAPGDLIVFATDGIAHGFAQRIDLDLDPQRIAGEAVRAFGRGTDDALVLAVRYEGGAP